MSTPTLDTIAFENELDRSLVTEDMAEQLADRFDGEHRILTVPIVSPLKNCGTMVELVVEKVVNGYKGLEIRVCLFDREGFMTASILETL